MALINCSECTKRYSSNAKQCPECANPTTYSLNYLSEKQIRQEENNHSVTLTKVKDKTTENPPSDWESKINSFNTKVDNSIQNVENKTWREKPHEEKKHPQSALNASCLLWMIVHFFTLPFFYNLWGGLGSIAAFFVINIIWHLFFPTDNNGPELEQNRLKDIQDAQDICIGTIEKYKPILDKRQLDIAKYYAFPNDKGHAADLLKVINQESKIVRLTILLMAKTAQLHKLLDIKRNKNTSSEDIVAHTKEISRLMSRIEVIKNPPI
jgi:hypothetical protein